MIWGMLPQLEDRVALLPRYLTNPAASWCVATLGAIAEFHIEESQTVKRKLTENGGYLVTEWGAMRVHLTETTYILPYETLSRRNKFWLHGINLCLPTADARMASRKVLTELGEDEDALRPSRKSTVLFDLGLDIEHMDACIRTSNDELIKFLRNHVGYPLYDYDNPSFAAIKEASPERVFKSKLGRIEVFQTIGSTKKKIPTPHGPHTHVLPRLLKQMRTHEANVYVPEGYRPSFGLFPPNPVINDEGKPKPFDRDALVTFQKILTDYDQGETVDAKSQVQVAVRMGKKPQAPDTFDRITWTAVRVGLRQLYWMDGESETLSAWMDAFENNSTDFSAKSLDMH